MITPGAENATKFTGGTAPEIGGFVVCAACAGSAADTIPRERKEARAFL
jgi:hypothetical protein